MPIDPFDRKPSDPFARSAAGKRAEDAKKPAPTKAPTVTTVTTTTAKPAPPGNPFKAKSFDPRLLLKPQL
jgi:hypothetical protein